jgi:hypothetical protein
MYLLMVKTLRAMGILLDPAGALALTSQGVYIESAVLIRMRA